VWVSICSAHTSDTSAAKSLSSVLQYRVSCSRYNDLTFICPCVFLLQDGRSYVVPAPDVSMDVKEGEKVSCAQSPS
jgi:hypothetical protein